MFSNANLRNKTLYTQLTIYVKYLYPLVNIQSDFLILDKHMQMAWKSTKYVRQTCNFTARFAYTFSWHQ